MNNTENKEKKIKPAIILYSAIILILAYVLILAVAIYFFRGYDNKLIRKTSQIIPYPVAMNGLKFISMGKLFSQLDSVKNFYENQDFSEMGLRVDFSTEDGKKRLKVKEKNILNKLIENSIIEKEARRRGIIITEDSLNQELGRKLNEYGSEEELKDNMQKLYGWNIGDFKKNIVKPDIYKEKLCESLKREDPLYEPAKNKIDEAKEKLNQGEDFKEIAKNYSEGESAKNGGELGWFSPDQMIPEVALVAFKTKKGESSEIIESDLGFHIIKIEDEKIENEIPFVRVSQIFTRTKPFSDWLKEIEQKAAIFIPLREFKWNKDEAKVEFREDKMKEFENNLLQNSPNDISVMF